MAAEHARAQVLATLDRFAMLVTARDASVISLFAADPDTRLVGSEMRDLARGPEEIREHLAQVFGSASRLSFEWRNRDATVVGDAAWIFADGEVVMRGPEGEQRAPYRLTVILEQCGRVWLWRHVHGSEPAPDR